MIFRNTLRLLLTNFSNVWKALLYYVICIVITGVVCWSVASPIINKLSEAGVFQSFIDFLDNVFVKPNEVATSLNQIIDTAWGVLKTNIQFKFNYVFLIVWILFVFPFTLDLAQLPLAEILYGFMTSQVKYSFTGRYIKNIGKSSIYTVIRYFVMLVLNILSIALLVGIIKLATLGFAWALLSIILLALFVCFMAFKTTLFACWTPAIAVLNINPFLALKKNFVSVFRRFFNIFSNSIALILTAFVVNAMFCVFTLSVSLIITLPLTAFVFVAFQMVSYFSSQGMRFYVYPDTFISPKRFEEQDKIKKLKNLI